MQTILLLGGFGFLGTNLMKYIDSHGLSQYGVIVFDKFDHHLHDIQFQCVEKTYSGDFSDSVLLGRIFDENKIDIVIHSLSTTVPVNSYNARYDVESNLLPTLDILSLMVRKRIGKIVYLSSGGAIYGVNESGNNNKGWKETDDVFPVSSYGVVKLTIEKYIMQFANLYGIKPLILRLSNPYGPYHYGMKQGVINVAIDKAEQGEIFSVWGDGTGKKDYIYVEDFVNILFTLLENNIYGDVFNIGSGLTYSVNDILELVKQIYPGFSWNYQNPQTLDVGSFSLDTSKLKSIIGNFKFTDMKEGLAKTHEWRKNG